MTFAVLNMPVGDWTQARIFMSLRAIHYLYDFYGVRVFHFSCGEIPDEARKHWTASLELRKKEVSFVWNVPVVGLAEFAAPDFPMYLEGRTRIDLNVPDIPGLTDFHVHSPLAYCRENINVPGAMEMELLSKVKMVNFSEHSSHLYFTWDSLVKYNGSWKDRIPAEDRSWKYKNIAKNQAGPHRLFGLELDVDTDSVVIGCQSPHVSGYRLGAIHSMDDSLSYEDQKRDYLRRLDALLAGGIQILAHPFRVFSWRGLPVPEDLFDEVAEKLVRAKVAAEINFHVNQPQPEFILLVLKKGGKISFGTDSHNLYEAGYLKPHYDFCKSLDIAGRLDEILLSTEK